MEYINKYFSQLKEITDDINKDILNQLILKLVDLKKNNGRIFFIGVGGSAANCSHAVNDFRKIAEIDAYTPLDNIAEVTARTNDEGFDTIFVEWLKRSKINDKDMLFVLSVGGGNQENNVSVNIIKAIDYCKDQKTTIAGIVGRDGGYVKKNSDLTIVIPTKSKDTITPHAESWQSILWHLIVSDPRILSYSNKWESIDTR